LNVRMAASPGFTEADLKLAAGAKSFERGLDYVDSVSALEVTSTQVTAVVYGSSPYGVCLTFGGGGLGAACTCPYGQDGFFCKHCVAVGLSVLRLGDELPRRIEAAQAQRRALDSWLESLSKEELLAELSRLLDEDHELRRRFELRAAAVNLDAAKVRHAVVDLISLPRRGYVEFEDAHQYASDVRTAIAAIDDFVESGGAADAILIAQEAIRRRFLWPDRRRRERTAGRSPAGL
jgi:uncharacterized Zn finger protein